MGKIIEYGIIERNDKWIALDIPATYPLTISARPRQLQGHDGWPTTPKVVTINGDTQNVQVDGTNFSIQHYNNNNGTCSLQVKSTRNATNVFYYDWVVNGKPLYNYYYDGHRYDKGVGDWDVVDVQKNPFTYTGKKVNKIIETFDNGRITNWDTFNEITANQWYNTWKDIAGWTTPTGWHDCSKLPNLELVIEGVRYRVNKSSINGWYNQGNGDLIGFYLEKHPYASTPTVNAVAGIKKTAGNSNAGWTLCDKQPNALCYRNDTTPNIVDANTLVSTGGGLYTASKTLTFSNLKRYLLPSEPTVMKKDGLERIGVTVYPGSPNVFPMDGRLAGVKNYWGIPATGLLSLLQHHPSQGGHTGVIATPDYIAHLAKDEVAVLDILTYRVSNVDFSSGHSAYLKESTITDGGMGLYRLYLRFNPDTGVREYQKLKLVFNNNGGDREWEGEYDLVTSPSFNKNGWKTWPVSQHGGSGDWNLVHAFVVASYRTWKPAFRFAPDGGLEVGMDREGNDSETMTTLVASIKIFGNPRGYNGEEE